MTNLKSSEFGCFWKSMFLVATSLYEKFNPKNPAHVKQRREVKAYMDATFRVLPCITCRSFARDVLLRVCPLNYDGREELMKSLYCMKNAVNQKLILQGRKEKKRGPRFETVYKQYTKLIVS